MKIYTTVKPRKLGFSTDYMGRWITSKDVLLAKISDIKFANKDKTVAYNLHKVNVIKKQVKYVKGPKKGQTKSTTIVKPSHWVAYVYIFDNTLVKNKTIIQKSRNFIIKD